MPCGGGSKHVSPRRAWLMSTSGYTGRRWKRRSTAIAMGKLVRSARDQVGATETANNRISIESDRGRDGNDPIQITFTCPQQVSPKGTWHEYDQRAATRVHL